MKNLILYSILGLSLIVTSGCKRSDTKPILKSLAELEGECLQGKIITGMRCTSAVYVQLLNADIGNVSTYNGKKYENLILVANFPKNFDLGADNSKSFYFTIDSNKDFENCTEFFPCQQIIVGTPEPSPVAIKVCIKEISTSNCPSDNEN